MSVDGLLKKIGELSADIQASNGHSLAELSDMVPTIHGAAKELVYLVDDDPVVLQVLGAQLSQAGYVVKTFSALAELYLELKTETPSLVILDIVFPQGPLAGVEALHTLRVKTGFQIPVIFILARNDIDARLKALRSGGHAFFSKPVDIKSLLQTCQNLTKAGEVKYRVLLVDDDKVCLLMHQTFLEGANFSVRCVNDPLQVLQEINSFKPDILVLDLKMPGCDGIEVAQILRQEKSSMFLPIIFLSGTDDPEEQAQMDTLENCEFLSKPVDREGLISRSLRHAREYQYLQNKLIELEGLESSSNVVSRYEFIGRLDEKLTSSAPAIQEHPCYLIYLVLDELDGVRKKAGLRSQGEVNIQLFSVIEDGLVDNELVAGQSDGILLILKYGSAASFKVYADKLLLRLRALTIDCSGTVIKARSRLGVVPLRADHRTVHDVIAKAEKLAAKAQHCGGDRCMIEALKTVSEQKKKPAPEAKRDVALQEAIKAKRFCLKFQPIVHMGDPSFDAFEVLLRLRAETGQEFLPEQFLPFFEEQNGLKDIDRWTYSSAIESLTQDQSAYHNAVLYLKVTKDTISNNLIATLISNFMREARVKGQGRIVFLLKQSDILLNLDQSIMFAKKVRTVGCKIGVEQSKPYFHRLYPDTLKLAKSTIQQARKDEKIQQQLRQFVKEMEERHVDIVVSEVESVVAMQLFYKWGIKLFQGYAIQIPGDTLQRDFAFESEH